MKTQKLSVLMAALLAAGTLLLAHPADASANNGRWNRCNTPRCNISWHKHKWNKKHHHRRHHRLNCNYTGWRSYPSPKDVLWSFRWNMQLPRGAVKINIGGVPYYHHHGRYYHHSSRGYREVPPPPVGSVAEYLPPEREKIVINGIVYYNYGGVYYKGGSAGYVVVPSPYTGVVVDPSLPTETYQANRVFVPNSNGSYTRVDLTPKGNGYVGPQGEFYPVFPTVDQLKPLYAS